MSRHRPVLPVGTLNQLPRLGRRLRSFSLHDLATEDLSMSVTDCAVYNVILGCCPNLEEFGFQVPDPLVIRDEISDWEHFSKHMPVRLPKHCNLRFSLLLLLVFFKIHIQG